MSIPAPARHHHREQCSQRDEWRRRQHTYRFTSASAADGDTILGFEPGDRVDLAAIDANVGAAVDQSFTLVTGAFTAAGQLAVTLESRADGDFTVIQGNIDGNADADFTVEIAGHQNLTNANLGL
jgi:hypothetical protein